MPPLSVRVQVAERQLPKMGLPFYEVVCESCNLLGRIRWLLERIFHGRACALDHDPALILRDYDPTVSDVAARYTPHAHDPNHLIYREKADHDRKTFGRTPGAERTVTTKGSDIWLKSKFNRLEGRTKQRPKQKITQRKNPWNRPTKAQK
jgi:hypothetical protein